MTWDFSNTLTNDISNTRGALHANTNTCIAFTPRASLKQPPYYPKRRLYLKLYFRENSNSYKE